MQLHWDSLRSTGLGVGMAETHGEYRGTPGAPSTIAREGQGNTVGAGRPGNRGSPVLPGFRPEGPGCPGDAPGALRSPAPPEPPPLPGAGRGAPPPPPVGGFTSFRGNECGAGLGASVTEVPGQAGTGRGWCRVSRCCRRPAPGEWPRGAAPAPPVQGSRAAPGRTGAPSLCLRAGCAGTERPGRGESAAPR